MISSNSVGSCSIRAHCFTVVDFPELVGRPDVLDCLAELEVSEGGGGEEGCTREGIEYSEFFRFLPRTLIGVKDDMPAKEGVNLIGLEVDPRASATLEERNEMNE